MTNSGATSASLDDRCDGSRAMALRAGYQIDKETTTWLYCKALGFIQLNLGRGVRVVEGGGLENR